MKMKKRLFSLLLALLLAAGILLPAVYAAEVPEEISVFEYVESITYLDARHPYAEMNRKREYVDWYFPTEFLFTFKDGSAQTVTVEPQVHMSGQNLFADDFEVTMPDGTVLIFDQEISYSNGNCQWYLCQCFYSPYDPHQPTVLYEECEGSWPPASLRERLDTLRWWFDRILRKILAAVQVFFGKQTAAF